MIAQHYYTWCSREAGCEGISGFQTRARSPSITAEIEEAVKGYCSRYELPRPLKHLSAKVTDLTEEELRLAPIAIHYYPVSESLIGLTRARLTAEQSGRGGNFLAHTLVFPPEALRAMDFNPFVLIRSGIFKDSAGDAPKALEDLAELPTSVARGELPTSCPHNRDLLSALLTCVLTPDQAQRPLVLSLPADQDCSDLIEALFLLLPTEYRATLSFSTYAPDPYAWRAREVQGAAQVRKVIRTIPPEEGGQFQFREDEFARGFYVFDLRHGRRSETRATPKYVDYVCDAVSRASQEALAQLHRLIGTLNLGIKPESWDGIIPAAGLVTGDVKMQPAAWPAAIAGLMSGCDSSSAASAGLGLLWQASYAALGELPADLAGELVAAYRQLMTNAGDPTQFRDRAGPEMAHAVSGLLCAGRYTLARELLPLAGEARTDARARVLVEAVTAAQDLGWPEAAPPKSGDEPQAAAFGEVLSEGLRELAGAAPSSPLVPRLFGSGLSAAIASDCLGRTWDWIADWLLQDRRPGLSPEQLAQVLSISGDLLESQRDYDRHRGLLLWQLGQATPAPESRGEFFSKLVSLCERSEDVIAATRQALTEASGALGEEVLLPLYVALSKSRIDPVREEATGRYRQLLKRTPDEQTRWSLRHRLATMGGVELLAWDCCSGLFPWNEPESSRWLRGWISEVFASSPEAASRIVSAVCDAAREESDPEMQLRALEACLRELREADLGEASARLAREVAEALIASLPLKALSEKRCEEALRGVDSTELGEGARARLQASKLLAEVKLLPGSDRPDLTLTLEQSPDLPGLLSRLDGAAWLEATDFLLSGFKGLYVEDPDTVWSAAMLVLAPTAVGRRSMLGTAEGLGGAAERPLRSSDALARHLCSELLGGAFRDDPVTRVRSLAHLGFIAARASSSGDLSVGDLSARAGQTSGPLSFPQAIARVVGRVLAEDSDLTHRMLRSYLDTHSPFERSRWLGWLDWFDGQVSGFMREARREAGGSSLGSQIGKWLLPWRRGRGNKG